MSLRLLRVDLGRGEVAAFSPPEDYVRDFLGGSGLAFRMVADRDLEVDPLGPENVLMFISGLLTGTPVPASCKVSVVARSPLTGLWSESTVGGFWGYQLRRTGYDGIIIEGRAPEPVYLWVSEDGVEIRSAEQLWGLDAYRTSEALAEELGAGVQVACIGPAGENLVAFAAVMVGGHEGRAAGRTGMGAVMGSKNLKAVAVRGSRRPPVADARLVAAKRRELLPLIRDNTRLLADFGTSGAVQTVEHSGDLPIRNWYGGSWPEGAARICGQRIVEEMFEGHYACYGCPIRCGKEVRVRVGEHAGEVAHGPEYETCAAFGSMVLNDDVDVLVAANDLANRLGLDTISAGAAVAFAMECSEKGLIGDRVPWGDGEAILGLLKDMAYRRGLGDLLAGGTRRAAAAIGGAAAEYAVETKGLEYAYHDPRAFTSMALVYATANRGACHLEGLTYFVEGGAFPGERIGLRNDWDRASSDDKAELAKRMQDYMGVFNALGLCKFLMRGRVGPEDLAVWVRGVTGREMDAAELMRTGERMFNLKRLVNVRLGLSRKDDALPPRLLSHPRPSGGAAGVLPHIGRMLHEYYRIRGWSEEGLPLPETLERLGLAGIRS